MKTNWNIDINNKIAELRNQSFLLKFKYDLELIESGAFILKKKEVITSSDLSSEEASKIPNLLRTLGDEFKLLYMSEKLEFLNEADSNNIKMYKIEDNLYVSQNGEICILKEFGFEDTDFMTAISKIDETISKNLIKSTIYNGMSIKYKEHTINLLSEEIDDISYLEVDSLEDFSIEELQEDGFSKNDIELILNKKCNILKVNETKLYIYDSYSLVSSEEDIKAVELLEALEEVLYNNEMEFTTWNEVLEEIGR